MKKLKSLQTILIQAILFILFGATLMQSNVFLSPFAFAYYGFNLVGSILMILVALLTVRQKQILIGNIVPVVALLLYTGFSAIKGIVIEQNTFNFGHIALYGYSLVLLSFVVLFATQKIDFLIVARILIFFVLIEGVLCIAQYFDFIEVRSKLFEVYGSLPNPNYTAMFLAMALPSLYYVVYSDKAIFRYLAFLSIGLLIISLGLLQCRSAVVGSIIGTSYFFALQYNWKDKIIAFIKETARWKINVVSTISCTLLLGFLTFLYTAKQNSSEGRLMIWKISLNLGLEKPILGHGTNCFERVYNLAQAAYFQSGKATEGEVFNAAHIRVPYNDYLLTFLEGGIIGFLLFLTFLGSLLFTGFFDKTKPLIFRTAYTGVLTFAVMALLNSQMYITAIMAIFILYAAIICSFEAKQGKSWLIGKNATVALAFGLFCLGIVFFCFQHKMALASRNVKIASSLIKKGNAQNAIIGLEKSSKMLYFSDQLWINYAWAFQNLNDYQQALNRYCIAEKYSADPEMLLDMAFCYTQLGSYNEAITKVTTAINIAPNRIKPRYALMNVYLAAKDTLNAKQIATQIMAQIPKGISKDATFYKQEAQNLLKK